MAGTERTAPWARWVVVLGVLALGCAQSEPAAVTPDDDPAPPEPTAREANGAATPADPARAPLAGASGEAPAADTAPGTAAAGNGPPVDPAMDPATMPPSADPAEMPQSADAPGSAGTPAPCSELQLLTLADPTLAPSSFAAPEPWPRDDRVVIPVPGAVIHLGISVTNTSMMELSGVAVWVTCPGQVRVNSGGKTWFESVPGDSTIVASVPIQCPAGEFDCQWHMSRGEPRRMEGCVVEANEVHLSVVVE